jgi:hypothetical protein
MFRSFKKNRENKTMEEFLKTIINLKKTNRLDDLIFSVVRNKNSNSNNYNVIRIDDNGIFPIFLLEEK